MLFNSISFAIFLIVAFAIFWLPALQTVRRRNLIVIITGSFFYGCWDIRFLGLLYLTATVDFFVAKSLEKSDQEKKRRRLILVSLISNLSVLGLFKYFNFFSESTAQILSELGFHPDFITLKVVLPVGISFYTFQALSYTIDVYKKRLQAITRPDVYLAYITFFPQLVAGPIARAPMLIPQFQRLNTFNETFAISGLRLMLWGFFKKSVIADNFSVVADGVFSGQGHYSSSAIIAAALAFTIQIYCDFSGYSDIARGCARLFGIDLMKNFRTPYFANSIGDFWRRWHISMSGWFRDYVYIPLGGSKSGYLKKSINLMATFLLSGLWHGAGWTYILWGAWHGTALITENVLQRRTRLRLPGLVKNTLVLVIVIAGWIMFRAESVVHAGRYYATLAGMDHGIIGLSDILTGKWGSALFRGCMVLALAGLFIVEYTIEKGVGIRHFQENRIFRWCSYALIIVVLLLFGVYNSPPAFIYFQF